MAALRLLEDAHHGLLLPRRVQQPGVLKEQQPLVELEREELGGAVRRLDERLGVVPKDAPGVGKALLQQRQHLCRARRLRAGQTVQPYLW